MLQANLIPYSNHGYNSNPVPIEGYSTYEYMSQFMHIYGSITICLICC